MFKKNKTIWIVAWSMIIALMATLCPQVVRSENADVAIYREVAAGDALTTANYDNDWDTIVREDTTSYTLVGGAGGTNVDLQAGHYAVMYGIRWDDDTGSARSVQHGQLNLDGSDLAIGWSQGYIRRTNSSDQSFVSSGGIIEVAVDGDDLIVQSFRTDVRTCSVKRIGNSSGVMFLKLDDEWDYLRLGKDATQAAPTDATWTDVTFNVQDEYDTDSFTHVSGSADITLKTAGHYLVFANVTFGTTLTNNGAGGRTEFQQRLTLGGAEIEGTRTTVYIRGNQTAERIQEGSTSIGTIIETSSTNQTLNVEVNEEDGDVAYTINLDKTGATVERTAITIVKLPDDGEYLRMEDSGADNISPSASTNLGWDTTVEMDSAAFTAPGTPDSRLEVEQAGDYMFFSSNHADATNLDRAVWRQGWHINGGSLIPYGQTGNYNRNSGSDDTGNWSGIIFNGLSANDYVETEVIALGNTGTAAQ